MVSFYLVGQCPHIGSLMESPCRISCSEDEDCENHGYGLLCCKALPGSSCEAECQTPVFVPNETDTRKYIRFYWQN